MATEDNQMKGALDRIREIAERANLVDGTPKAVSDALGDIIAIARYGFDVTAGRGGQAGTAPTFVLSESKLDGDDKLG